MAGNAFLSSVESIRRPPSRSRGTLSVLQRWKLRRNLVIYVASQNGMSLRLLGDVFDLPHSRISAIIKELQAKHAT